MFWESVEGGFAARSTRPRAHKECCGKRWTARREQAH